MGRRLPYLLSVGVIITLGILSRKIPFFPLFIGDALYAVMVYFILRAAFLRPIIPTAVAALLICFVIEFSQLLTADWIVALRHTTLGHYALGQGFLLTDLAAYLLGCVCALGIDTLLYLKKRNDTPDS